MKAVILLLLGLVQQDAVWDHVTPPTSPYRAQRSKFVLSKSQEMSILRALPVSSEDIACANFSFSNIAVSKQHKVMLVSAGQGCLLGGQGSNGSLYLVQFDHKRPVLVGSLEGWIYSIQKQSAHEYRHIIVGWHWSAFESGLAYFQFDGQHYKQTNEAILCDGKIVRHPERPRCLGEL